MRYWLDEGNICLWLSAVAIIVWLGQYTMLVDWWKNAPGARGTRWIGITIVGLALCLLVIYIPSLMALAWPGRFAGFASTTWYRILAVVIVNASAVFILTRVATWEYLRRQRTVNGPTMPQELAGRLAELEAENAWLRERLAEALGN